MPRAFWIGSSLTEGTKIRDEEVIEILGLIDQKILSDTIEAIADHDAGRCMEIVEQIYQFGYDIQRFCQELLQYLRNLILLKVSSRPEPFLELPEEEILSLKGQAEKFQFDRLNQLFGFLLKGEEEVAQSTFPRTMVEMALIRMAMLRPLRPIDEIIKKLEEMGKTQVAAGRREPAEIPPLKKIAEPDPEQKEGKKEEDASEAERREERKTEKKRLSWRNLSDDKDEIPLAPREAAGDSEGSQERETLIRAPGRRKKRSGEGWSILFGPESLCSDPP